jgi:4-alpha-glucanotransferase
MKIKFSIPFATKWGQQIGVCGNIPELGNGNPELGLILTYFAGNIWSGAVNFQTNLKILDYKYFLFDENTREIKFEEGSGRKLQLSDIQSPIFLSEYWQSTNPIQKALHTAAFTKVVFARSNTSITHTISISQTEKKVKIFTEYVSLLQDEMLCITGNLFILGHWDINNPLILDDSNFPNWEVEFGAESQSEIEFKFGIYSSKQKRVIRWEEGDTRKLSLDEECQTQRFHLTIPQLDTKRWKGAGVALPVFSLKTNNSLGVGEFLDLIPVVDWAQSVGLKLIQILPINDTSATFSNKDSYPYAAISVFALHPIYLNLEKIGVPKNQLTPLAQKLNSLTTLQYEEVIKVKLEIARAVYEEDYHKIVKDNKFLNFVSENQHWLDDYALFCLLRDQYKTVNFEYWEGHAIYHSSLKSNFSQKELLFYSFLQYHLHLQLSQVAHYAREKGIVLKGDLPIGIYRYSVDAWVAPHLYNMNGQAGAPPDAFAKNGQNWGFPTYNWKEMAKDEFGWWKNRFKHLSKYFDAFRIDHILGFFRIWQIPYEQIQGILGIFNPAVPLSSQDLNSIGYYKRPNRFIKPFITDTNLLDTFKKDTPWVKHHLLNKDLSFKKKVNTQRKIQTYLEAFPEMSYLKEGIFNLIANVLLVEDSEGNLHPRFNLHETNSFHLLESDIKDQLSNLYHQYFYVRQEHFWEQEARKKLPAVIGATNMLICGEDLGMIPSCVPGVMDDLGILSLEIQRMSKNPAHLFVESEDIPYLSVMSTSTHDMEPIRLWWESCPSADKQVFYNSILKLPGKAPKKCNPILVQRMINMHLNWPGMWAVFPLQDLLALDSEWSKVPVEEERINVPSNPNHYWNYRFHCSLEELGANKNLNRLLLGMVLSSGR